MAARDARTRLGGDIFIHGDQVSIGCVAMGDPAIEELFTLVAETGHQRVKVIIAPQRPPRQRRRYSRGCADVGGAALPHRRGARWSNFRSGWSRIARSMSHGRSKSPVGKIAK